MGDEEWDAELHGGLVVEKDANKIMQGGWRLQFWNDRGAVN